MISSLEKLQSTYLSFFQVPTTSISVAHKYHPLINNTVAIKVLNVIMIKIKH